MSLLFSVAPLLQPSSFFTVYRVDNFSVFHVVSDACAIARAVYAEMINAELILALSSASKKNHSFH